MRVADGVTEQDADEVAVVLPLEADPTLTMNPAWGDRLEVQA